MKTKNAFSTIGIISLGILATFAAESSFAKGGKEGGNGGLAFVCRDSSGNVSSAELADFFESENDPTIGFKIARNEKDPEQQIDTALVRLETAFPTLGFDARYFRKTVNDAFAPLSMNAIPADPADYHIVVRKKACPLEVVALHKKGKILLNQDIYDKLLPTDQAGLRMHELLYWVGRENANVDVSDSVRPLNAALFSSVPVQDLEAAAREYASSLDSDIVESQSTDEIVSYNLILRDLPSARNQLELETREVNATYSVGAILHRSSTSDTSTSQELGRMHGGGTRGTLTIPLSSFDPSKGIQINVDRLSSPSPQSRLEFTLWDSSRKSGAGRTVDLSQRRAVIFSVSRRVLSKTE